MCSWKSDTYIENQRVNQLCCGIWCFIFTDNCVQSHFPIPYKNAHIPVGISLQPTSTMKFVFALLALFGLSWIASGNDCKDFKRKVRAVIGPILGKRKGLHVTLSPDDLANLVGLKHGRSTISLIKAIICRNLKVYYVLV